MLIRVADHFRRPSIFTVGEKGELSDLKEILKIKKKKKKNWIFSFCYLIVRVNKYNAIAAMLEQRITQGNEINIIHIEVLNKLNKIGFGGLSKWSFFTQKMNIIARCF